MFNAIPAINLLGTSNPMLEQSNLVKIPHDIRTNNSEQLAARSVADVKKNAKGRNAQRHHDQDEEEPEGGEESSLPQPRHKPTIQERLLMARQGKVSINQRAVNALFLQQSKGRGDKREPSEEDRPSIDVVA
ncbi:MAG: hypothetical protein HQL91_06145 [Magnetococcales bacterium]|nr:hypothetical protein [Magnetococcales bacterium]